MVSRSILKLFLFSPLHLKGTMCKGFATPGQVNESSCLWVTLLLLCCAWSSPPPTQALTTTPQTAGMAWP